mgnify:CR=1 FL=1
MNIAFIENIDQLSGEALERRLGETLRTLLAGPAWLGNWQVEVVRSGVWDLLASGPLPAGGRAQLCVEVKKHFAPSQFQSLAGRPCDSQDAIGLRALAMVHVSPRLAELCNEHGWSWFDLAGNCRLEIPGALLIERSGNAIAGGTSRRRASLGSEEAGLVVRALLATANAGRRWTQRSVVGHFSELPTLTPEPSLSLVNKVVQHLRREAFLEELPDRGFRVRDYEGLLKAWTTDYRPDSYVRRAWFTLLRGRALSERLASLEDDRETKDRALYAAFSAAEIQAPAVRQPRTWLMVDPFGETRVREALEATAVDSGDNIVVLLPNHPGPFYWPDAGAGRLPCTNPVQTYVDLAHLGGRGEEAAAAILEQCLTLAWKQGQS